MPGSEGLRIEWRDPLTGRATDGSVLVRGEDYEIDWVSGRIVLARPLSSVSGPPVLATGEPFAAQRAVLVADYQHAATGPEAEDLQGGRVAAALGPLALSAHGANEERSGGYRLGAATATLDLGAPLLRPGRGGPEPRVAVRRGRGERIRAESRRRDLLRAARRERR